MKKVLPYLISLLLLSTYQSFCQGPQVLYINSGYIQFKYECITNQQTFDVDYKAFKITNLVYNQNYEFETRNSTIFESTGYEPYPFLFDPYGSFWTWVNPTYTIDTIVLNFWGHYTNLNLGSSEWLRFGISTVPYPSGQTKDISVSIVSDMSISGNDLFCNNPVSFNLLNMPTSYTSATWKIMQGTTIKASGSGTNASASNLSNGPGQVSFTIDFLCGLNDLTFTKNFWLGTPVLNVTGPSEGTIYNTYTFQAQPIGPSSNATNFEWTIDPLTDCYLYPFNNNYQCAITFYTPHPGYRVKARAQNSCGTGSYGSTSIYIGEYFLLSPNPASENVTITKKVSSGTNTLTNDIRQEDLNVIYTIRIIDIYGALHYSATKTGDSFTLPVSNLKNGTYIIKVINGKNISNLQLIIKH